MPNFNLYSAWMDTHVYFWSLLFFAALVALIYSIRKYLELANSDFNGETEADDAALLPESGETEGSAAVLAQDINTKSGIADAEREQGALSEQAPREVHPLPAAEPAGPSPAESFVRGIYEGISGLDARLKDIEVSLSKGRSNNEFVVKFLEDMAADMNSLDKAKIKARIEFLLSDLKK